MMHTENMIILAVIMGAGLFVHDATQSIWSNVAPPFVEGTGSIDKPVMAGEDVLVDWTIAKRTDCPGYASRVWRGENGFYMVEQETPTTLKRSDDFEEYSIHTHIPSQVPPGMLKMVVEGFYECSPGDRFPFTLGPVEMQVVSGRD